MKKFILPLLSVTMLASILVACSSKPSEEEVIDSIKSGTITLEDAVERGYVDEQWAEDYKDENSVAGIDKNTVNLVSEFTTTDIAGNEYTFKPSETPTFFIFVNADDQEALEQLELALNQYVGIVENNGDMLVLLKSNTTPDILNNYDVDTIYLTDDLRKNFEESNLGMIDSGNFIGCWNKNASFITAWYGLIEENSLIESAKAFSSEENSSITGGASIE